MATLQKSVIHSFAALSIGDDIEAWRDGALLDRGRVSRTLSSVEMVWIVSARTGALKLVDLAAADIIRFSPAPCEGLPVALCSSGGSSGGSFGGSRRAPAVGARTTVRGCCAALPCS